MVEHKDVNMSNHSTLLYTDIFMSRKEPTSLKCLIYGGRNKWGGGLETEEINKREVVKCCEV